MACKENPAGHFCFICNWKPRLEGMRINRYSWLFLPTNNMALTTTSVI